MTITLHQMGDMLAEAAQAITAPIHIGSETTEAYFRHLGDLPIELLQASLDYCIQEGDNSFFPSVQAIRSAAKKLMAFSMGMPSAGEAWGMVLEAKRQVGAVYCAEGAGLRDAIDSMPTEKYWTGISEYHNHLVSCSLCKAAHEEYQYGHPVVAATVRQLGGNEAIRTENLVADRARFMDAFVEIVDRELRLALLSPSLRRFTETTSGAMRVQSGIDGLVARLSAPVKKLPAGETYPPTVQSTDESAAAFQTGESEFIRRQESHNG